MLRKRMPDRCRLWAKLAVCVVCIIAIWTTINHLKRPNSELSEQTLGSVNEKERLEDGVSTATKSLPTKGISPVKVDVYYETLCPDSKSFVVTQLVPTVDHFPPEVLNVTLVPYGKATTRRSGSGYEFSCQHGPVECEGNKVHACAIANNNKDTKALVKYISCMIHNNRSPFDAGRKCNEEQNFGGWENIEACANGAQGSELLAKYGDMSHGLNPPIDFIPTVIVDGRRADMWKALQNLKGVVCDRYPFTPREREQYC